MCALAPAPHFFCAASHRGMDDLPSAAKRLKETPAPPPRVVPMPVMTWRLRVALHVTAVVWTRCQRQGRRCLLPMHAPPTRWIATTRSLSSRNALEEGFADTHNTDGRGRSLLTPQVARELLARWLMQSLNETTEARASRDTVTLLDHGAPVRLRHGDTTPYTVVEVSEMAGGQYWVDVVAAASTAGDRRRVDRDDVVLHPPKPVYFDPLLPADELNSPRGTSTCLFLASTLALRGRRLPHDNAMTVVGGMQGFPRKVSVRMGHCACELRKRLRVRCLARRSGVDAPDMTPSRRLELQMMHDCVTLRYAGRTIEVLQRTLERLSLLWDARLERERGCNEVNGGCAASARELWQCVVTQQATAANGSHTFVTSEPFFISAFTMLLRYRSLLGDMGYNQGPHAAVPPSVMRELHDAFDVRCEAFASPINAQLPLFGSLFPDTDYCFGSLGSFFDLKLIAGHYEMNPPFVTAVLQRLETFLLHDVLACHDGAADSSLLFVVVLPSHDLDAAEAEEKVTQVAPTSLQQRHTTKSKLCRSNNNNTYDEGCDGGGGGEGRERWKRPGSAKERVSTERVLRESSFCLAHTLCAAAESAYVDGHQHLLRAPLFCIGTPTRLIVLGNSAARRRYGDAAEKLATVKDTWRRYTLESKLVRGSA
ncbi:hypothetical protein TraAM80_04879 [Trypanosoma rangeli]|uniref:PCIF1 WW domain-containing protein n=1 Tax=Trypanosoma rangeli TaxID=5698 RepID=A0A422NH06_TRYRA|nr:uncharacterized protein TraAM80_04879 [Trypanosoma rangeli]RNF04737.1 hypothetical protein TraAM80_04879 [Trypanosoma rangeli]|eukprot:RNF04737.1 hypothetical protein TraAM80_04879 [Trypanosoma rangeli]